MLDTRQTLDITHAIDYRRCMATEKDATFYWDTDSFDSQPSDILFSQYIQRMRVIASRIRTGERFDQLGNSIDESIYVKLPSGAERVRASLCLSHRGRLLSGTFRGASWRPELPDCFPYHTTWPSAHKFEGAVIQNAAVAATVLDHVDYRNGNTPGGLIVLAGSTKSGKSQVARAVALEAIRRNVVERFESGPSGRFRLKANTRMPHLVTFEDPIEEWEIEGTGLVCDDDPCDSIPSVKYGFCFTPRQKGIDSLGLQDALADAKRQSPTCFYVGEVRKASDWRGVIEFAGSGHLVIATTHAGSLVEMIARMLRATHASSPLDRRSVASQLLACIHLELRYLSSRPDCGRILTPSMWLRSGASLSALVADGLSAVVPDNASIFSRAQAATLLMPPDLDPNTWQDVYHFARQCDASELRRQ